MAREKLFGINEYGIAKIVLEIYDYSERINFILNSIEDNMDEANSSLMINDKKILSNKISLMKDNFINFKANILSYSNEMLRVKKGYQQIDENVAYDAVKTIQSVKIGKNYYNQKS